jgi:uncharacterized membrane protein YsdA (DUF1294 family)
MTLEIWFVTALLLTLNLVAFLAQGIDKRLARNGSRRISEKRLLWLGVPRAAPGMWLGMRVFHHKTNKPGFLAFAVLVTLANFAILWGLYELWSREWLDFHG